MPRLRLQWLADGQTNPIMPPFPVYSNRGFDDAARMTTIAGHARAAPPGRWSAPDFLQSPARAEASRFTATINSLGFRDPERSAAKKPGTVRVLCLGAYQTFGHGVDDGETYPRRLEALLNRGGGRRYEVWNGGRQAATAIVGLARLRSEGFALKPDLVVLEYGFVDGSVVGDDTMVTVMRLPRDSAVSRAARRGLRRVLSVVMGRSYVVNALIYGFWASTRADNVARWRDVMAETIREIRARGIPVVLLADARQTMSAEAYAALAGGDPGVRYLSVQDVLSSPPPTEQEKAAFDRSDNWTTEFGPSKRGLPSFYPDMINIWHPNGMGYARLARALTPIVRRLTAAK